MFSSILTSLVYFPVLGLKMSSTDTLIASLPMQTNLLRWDLGVYPFVDTPTGQPDKTAPCFCLLFTDMPKSLLLIQLIMSLTSSGTDANIWSQLLGSLVHCL